jgi:hypothetical protein
MMMEIIRTMGCKCVWGWSGGKNSTEGRRREEKILREEDESVLHRTCEDSTVKSTKH